MNTQDWSPLGYHNNNLLALGQSFYDLSFRFLRVKPYLCYSSPSIVSMFLQYKLLENNTQLLKKNTSSKWALKYEI